MVKVIKIDINGKVDIDEMEHCSNCCDAPPLYDLYEEEKVDTIGICMACGEGAVFERVPK
tara:strand:- start:26 stop:205 length:180 start_codon:yes stop_codon:yes gene_type:complete